MSVTISRNRRPIQDRNVGSARDVREGEYICNTQPKRLDASNENNLLLDPTSDVIWPGAILSGSSIESGQYQPIAARRAPLTVSANFENTTQQISKTVEEPRLSSMRQALTELRRGAPARTRAAIDYELIEVHSKEQLLVALNAHYGSGANQITGSFDFSSKSVENKIVLRYFQKYYSIDVDTPVQPSDFFREPRRIGQDEVYVSSVDFGRMLFFTVESTEDQRAIRAALNAAISGGGGSVKGEHQKVLQNSRVRVIIQGGSAEDGIRLITNGASGINDYLRRGANYSSSSPSAPLAYRLRFVSDNAIANVLTTTTYNQRVCTKTTGKFNVVFKQLTCLEVDDPGDNEEFYGTVDVSASGTGDIQPSPRSHQLWNVPRDRYIQLKKDESRDIDNNVVFRFDNVHKNKDYLNRSSIELRGHLMEADFGFWNSDDDFGVETRKIRLNGALGEFTLRFQHGRSKANMVFEIRPVE